MEQLKKLSEPTNQEEYDFQKKYCFNGYMVFPWKCPRCTGFHSPVFDCHVAKNGFLSMTSAYEHIEHSKHVKETITYPNI